jgi:GAF domain-containing protein
MLARIRKLLSPPILENKEDALAASLLYTILLILIIAGLSVPLALNMASLLNNPDEPVIFGFGAVLMGLFLSGLALALLETTRRGRVRLAGVIMAGTLFLLTTLTIAAFRGTRDTAIGMYVLVIAMAGLLLGGRAAFVFTGLTLLATLGIFLAETNGLLNITFTETPHIVEWVIYAVVVFLTGILLRFAFDTLNRALRQSREANEELENIRASLAERVAARTQDLELAAEIGRHISQVQEPEEILLEAVELIRSRFDLYYTQIYLVDAVQNNLVLRAGTGIVGRQLRQLGHRLPIGGSSINGTAVINKEPVIVADTAASTIFRQNPLLPETRSEMAVPLIVSGSVIGSLNLQSAEPHGLSEENLPAFEALAGQLAVALDNARLFSETAEAQENMESLARRFTRSGWDLYLNAIDRQENIGYTYNLAQTEFAEAPVELDGRPSFAIPINLGGETLGKIEVHGNEWTDWQKEHEELTAAVGQRVAQQIENLRLLSETERYRAEAEEATRRLTREGWEKYLEGQGPQSDGYSYDRQEVTALNGGNGYHEEVDLVRSLIVRGESIGQLEVEGIQVSDEEAAELVEAVSERLSAHIENLRLSSQTEVALLETERKAKELGVINDLARTVSQQLNLDQILETVHERIGRIMPADAFIIGLYEHETNLIDYPFIYDEGKRYEGGTSHLEKDSSIYKVLLTGESLVVKRVLEDEPSSDELLKKNALGDRSKPSRSMMFVPLNYSNLTVGVMSVQSYQYNAYSNVDLALVEGIASHVSVAIQNAQLFEQTQLALAETEDQASRLALLTEMGQALTGATTLEEVYQATAERAHKILDSNRTSVTMLDDDGEYYTILALGGEAGISSLGERQPLEGSNVGVAVRENRLVVVNQSKDTGLPGILSFMIAPLIASGRIIGTLNIGSKSANVFGQREERLLLQIASLLATTIESRRLLLQTQQRAEELAVVNRIAQAVSQELEQEQMLNAIFEEISHILPVDAFIVAVYHEDTDLLEYPLIYDDGQRYRELGLRKASPTSMIVKAIHQREPSLILRTREEVAKRAKTPASMIGNVAKVSASLMYVPLFIGKRSTGAVSVQSYEFDAYGPDDLALLEGIGNHVAVALENARLFEETQQRAEELSVVNQVAQVVSQMLELNELYSAVHEQIQRAILSDAFYIAIYNKEENNISFPYLYDDGAHYNIDPVPANPELEVVQVIDTREPILVNHSDPDVAVESFPSDILLASGKAPTSMIFVPLRSGLEPVGAISVQNYQSHNYTQADVDLLSGIAYHLAVALENARLFSETQQRAEELAAINEIAQAVSGQTEQQELLETVYEQIGRIMQIDAFTVTSFDPVAEMIHYLLVMDEGQRFYEEPNPLGTGAISKVLIEGRPILMLRTPEEIEELAQNQSVLMVGNVQRFSASLLFVPLHIGSEIIGGMSVQSYEFNAYTEAQVDLLVGIANHVAVALENARLFNETQTTLAETELLYNMGTHINRAASLEDLVSVVGVPGIAPGAQSAGLFRFELDENGEAEWMQLEASWIGQGKAVMLIGTRLYLPEIPLAAAELYTPNDPFLIGNIAEDERVDKDVRLLLQGIDTKAMAIIPMQQLGTWIGTLIIRWGETYTFTLREQRLYTSLARQMSTALSNQLLLTETQDRAAQLEKITQIETALSQAADEAGILEAMALLLEPQQAVSLHYAIEEDQPNTLVTVAHWENGELLNEDELHYEPFDVKSYAGLNLGLERPGEVSFISDIQADGRIQKAAAKAAKKLGFAAVVVIPLRSAGRWQGFVSVEWPETHEFSAAEMSIWEQLHEPLSAIVATRRAYLAQQEALSETAVLHESGAQISVARSYDEVLAVIRKNTVLGQNVTNVSIMLFEKDWRQDDIPDYADVLAFWSQTPPEQVRMRFYFDHYASAEKILQKASSQPLIFNDVPNSPDLDEDLRKMLVEGFDAATYVLFPMIVRGEWIGYVNAMYPRQPNLPEKDIRRAEAIIRQAGVAVQGLRNLEQAEHQAQEAQNRSSELAAINRVVTTVVSSFDLEVVLDTVAGELIELFAVQHVGIALMTPDKTGLKIIADRSANPEEESALGVEIPLAGNKLTRQVIETRRPAVVENAQTNPLTEPVHEIMRWRQTEVLVLLPLISGRETIGTLGLDIAEKDRVFSDAELKLAETIVAQIATAVQNVRLFEQTEARAQELAILNEISQELTATQSVESILDSFQDYVSRLMEAQDAYITLVDDVHDELVFRDFGTNDEGPTHFRLPKGSGLADYVIRTQQPLLLSADVEEHLAELDVARIGRAPQSWLGAPLMSGMKAVGMVAVQSFSKQGLYTERHRNLLMAVANQIAIAVESARLFEQAQARSAELSILNEMGRSLTALVDMDAILDNVYRYTSRLMDTTNFYISFFDIKRNEITFALDIRGERVMRNTGTRKAGKGLTEHIINTKESLLISENVDKKLDELGIEKIGPLAASWMGVPMMVGSQVIGVIGLQHWDTPRVYNEQHVRLLNSIASQAAIAIENARLFEQIQARARRERILREVTARVRGATDADSVMQTAVQEVGRALGRRTFVYLDQDDQKEIQPAKEEAYGD